ncbi:MAG: ATP synthase F1 subunit epsilon [Coriobacteriales bacterium]|jgi:F-type H+-transporting ATPase subunit epsilon|nr:ATP synthase F1 subunit epsilon [Coriobacteriales bacterium]
MANLLKCDIVAPDKMLFRGEGVLISAPAAEGDVGFMHQCAPLMSILRRGSVRIKSDNDEMRVFAVDGGYIEADGSKVVVLASRAIDVADIDPAISQQRIADNQQHIAQLPDGDPALAFAQSEIAWQQHLLQLKTG